MLFLVVILSSAALAAASQGYQDGTVYISGPGKAKFVGGKMDKGGDAYGFYNNTLLTTGWGVLEIKAGYNEKTSNNDLMYAAGFLEGVFTAQQIGDHYTNMYPVFINGKDPKKLEVAYRSFLQKQETWTRNMITKYSKTDSHWRHMGYIMSQLDGLYDGYKSVSDQTKDPTRFIFQYLNAIGDMVDLSRVLDKESRINMYGMSPAELRRYVNNKGHCSALVKVTGAYENIFMSHNTWFVYQSSMRIYKHYHFNIRDPGTAAKDMSFSSYPGLLISVDDFYMMGSNLVLLQTTNNIFKTDLYDLVTHESLLAWQRVRLSNLMAHSGQEWYEVFKQYNSGTYNNQYMVIDLKRVELKKSLNNDALWVVEQIPGLVRGADQTPILRTGYWPSYNVPFYEDIYNISGYPEAVALGGTDTSYQLAPRAKIFRRDQATVKDMATMKHIMRYNDYKNDPYSEGKPCDTICCRGDLDDEQPSANGCYDVKVSDLSMALQLQSSSISGPTLGNNLKPFSWTGEFEKTSHVGLPQEYDFDWQDMKPVY